MKKILSVLILTLLIGVAYAQLNETQLKEQIAERVSRVTGLSDFTADHVIVEEKQPIHLGNMELWAVKVKLIAPDPKQKPGQLLFVTDPQGKYQFSKVALLSTGKNVLEETLSEMRTISLDSLSKYEGTIYRGKGSHNVVMISDPFCPYCRKTYEYLRKHRDNIKSLSLLHFPLSYHANSKLLCSLLVYCDKHNVLNAARYLDLADYLYRIKYRRDDRDGTKTMEDILGKFPELKKHFSAMKVSDTTKINRMILKEAHPTITYITDKLKEQAIASTPVLSIDGHRIDGFRIPMIQRYLD
ncbi:MAG: hypothetical protein DRG83_15870 [Deltaproteobacteria bacterium]|nr:MAG: hypothetical protein DRG83_15870 [Deltaproteobacteria bacterium]